MINTAQLHPRKLPGQRRSAATVSAIVEAAAHILERGGLGSYSTNTIAERAGASIGSLYQYFPNKDAITRALILREKIALRDSMISVDDRKSGRDRLRELIAAGIKVQTRRPALAPFLEMEEARLPIDADMTQLIDEMAAVFREILNADDMPTDLGGNHVLGDIETIICGMVRSAGTRGETDRLAERVTAAAFGYLGIQPVKG